MRITQNAVQGDGKHAGHHRASSSHLSRVAGGAPSTCLVTRVQHRRHRSPTLRGLVSPRHKDAPGKVGLCHLWQPGWPRSTGEALLRSHHPRPRQDKGLRHQEHTTLGRQRRPACLPSPHAQPRLHDRHWARSPATAAHRPDAEPPNSAAASHHPSWPRWVADKPSRRWWQEGLRGQRKAAERSPGSLLPVVWARNPELRPQ